MERDVDKVIGYHLDNFNRIFNDQGKNCRFESKADLFISTGDKSQEKFTKFIGVPDNVLTLGSKVLSFIKINGQTFDLFNMYKEDIQYKSSDFTRGDIGRTDFCVVIEQVYGYMAFNNLPYGCVTFLDVTYFLSRPKSRTLLISDPIFNNSRNPTLLQTIYYFVELVLVGHYTKKKLKPSLMATESISEILEENIDESMKEESDDEFSLLSDSNNESDYSDNNNRTKYKLDIDSLRAGNVIGSGATCQVIKLKNRNIVVKNCDIRNATE